MGTPAHIAEVVTQVLLGADLRGIDTHGHRLLPYYLRQCNSGRTHAAAEPRVLAETATTVHLDGGQGLGQYGCTVATGRAVSKAAVCGTGVAVLNNSTHNGALSAYVGQAARAGMVAMGATACAPHVAPHGGAGGLHGTNPIAYGCPGSEPDAPLVFDLSTGHSAAGLRTAAASTGRLPEGRVLDAGGQPTTDPQQLGPGWILPVAGHVGYGLGLLVDILACALGGAAIGMQMPLPADSSSPYQGSFFILAINPAPLGGVEAFRRQIAELMRQVQAVPPADPAAPVRWPGERAAAEYASRSRNGIPVESGEWDSWLRDLGECGVILKEPHQ